MKRSNWNGMNIPRAPHKCKTEKEKKRKEKRNYYYCQLFNLQWLFVGIS